MNILQIKSITPEQYKAIRQACRNNYGRLELIADRSTHTPAGVIAILLSGFIIGLATGALAALMVMGWK